MTGTGSRRSGADVGAVTLDPGVVVLDGGRVLLGGDPPRALRLTDAGATALSQLVSGTAHAVPAHRALAKRLIEAGIAHPRSAREPTADVTVAIPVRDRPGPLDRCLAAVGPAAAVIVVDDGSRDCSAVAEVCARHGARLIRRPVSGGPAAARNAALTAAETDLVAFLDSDCVPHADWLEFLCGALADPSVGAAAPRVQPVPTARSAAVAHFAAARSPLDLGPRPAAIRPGGRIAYAPGAALLVRRAALGSGFDEALRYGEDVDLVWRLYDAGWRIRYEPRAVVSHYEPELLRSLLARRFRYGTGAGPLARRHPARLAPVVIHPHPAAIVALTLAGRPRLAVVAAAGHVVVTARTLRRLGVPARPAARLALVGVLDSAVAIGRTATMLAPGALVAALLNRRTRPGALALVLAEPLRSWLRQRPEIDPIRWVVLAVADDVAYGAGVLRGSLRARTTAPLRPTVAPVSRGSLTVDRARKGETPDAKAQ